MQTVLQASSARPCPEAYAYAGRLMKQGWGVQNAAKAAGVCVSDLRDYGVRPVEREAVVVPPRPITVRPKPKAAKAPVAPRPIVEQPVVVEAPPVLPVRASGRLTVREIVLLVSWEEAVSVEALFGQRRTRAVTLPRHRLYWLIRRLRPDVSYPAIGRHLGGRDHTTILHGVQKTEARCAERPEEVERLRHLLSVIDAYAASGAIETRIAAVEAQLAELRAIRAASLRIAA